MAANTTAHTVRSPRTPEQHAKVACDKAMIEANADALSLKLYRLIEIVRLAAYATENGRGAKEGDTSEVLNYVADELHGVNSDFTEAVYHLARAKNGGAA